MNNENFNIAKDIISNGTDPVESAASGQAAGIGSVILSREVSREQYIENCYRNNVITIKTNRDEFIKNCFVSKNLWNDITFPESNKDVGSLVVWINIPIYNRRVIVAILNKKNEVLSQLSENTSTLGNDSKSGFAKISIDSDLGKINIFTNSSAEGSGLKVKVTNEDGLGICDFNVQGDFKVDVENGVSLNADNSFDVCVGNAEAGKRTSNFSINKGEGLALKDEFDNTIYTDDQGVRISDHNKNAVNMDDDGIHLLDGFGNKTDMSDEGITHSVTSNKKINLIEGSGEGSSEGTLYEPLKDTLDDLINRVQDICQALSQLTVDGTTGVILPPNSAQFQQLSTALNATKQNIQKIKSKTVKLT